MTDFGLAKRVNESGQTQSGAVMGTPSYMAPEQAAGKISAIGPLVDVYALGAILYELLTRRPPFRGETLLETLEQVRSHEPIPPRQLQPRLHRDLDTICLKALAKEPGKRYATALALAEDLERFANGESILARREGFVEKTWRRVRRHPVAYAVTPIVLLALAIAGYATWATRSESRRVTGITRKIETSIDAPELSGDYLNAVNADRAELRRLAPDHADELRRRLHRRFADQVRDSFSFHRKPVLPPADAERTRTLIDLLEGEHPEDAGLVNGARVFPADRAAGSPCSAEKCRIGALRRGLTRQIRAKVVFTKMDRPKPARRWAPSRWRVSRAVAISIWKRNSRPGGIPPPKSVSCSMPGRGTPSRSRRWPFPATADCWLPPAATSARKAKSASGTFPASAR